MTGWPAWLAVVSLVVLGLLIVVLMVWTCRSELRTRRQARAAAEVAARYRRERRLTAHQREDEDAATEPLTGVTVAELVNRVAAEGLPVRLQWEDGDRATGWPEEWPTGVIPRVEDTDQ